MSRITVSNLHKEFRIYQRPRDRLWELVLRRPRHKIYPVLRDISFTVADGSSLGIIGVNGAGKSTLLKLLVGTLQPSRGAVQLQGQVAALLELGAGFHPEFSGRHNIYLNASLLGVADDNIAELEADIIAFSELGYFIDRPVKTYSSGMFVRLAFAIATMVRPDILIIDEALSVGDMAFQRKCVERINRFRAEHKTMVFCSHSMFHIQQLCDIAIWLDKGRIRAIGDSRQVVGDYEDFCNSKKSYNSIQPDLPAELTPPQQSGAELAAADDSAPATRDCRIHSLAVRDQAGRLVDQLVPLTSITLEMEVEVLQDGIEGNFGFAFMKSAAEPQASFLTTEIDSVEKGPFRRGDRFTVTLVVHHFAMRVGEYHVLGGLADKSGLLWYETRTSAPLSVKPTRGVGPVVMASDWSVTRR